MLYFTSGGFDPVHGVVIVFGGGSLGVDQTSTWIWNGRNWQEVSPVNNPPARELFGTVWDPATRQFLIFGGLVFSTGSMFNDTWALN